MAQIGNTHAFANAFQQKRIFVTFTRFSHQKNKGGVTERRASGLTDQPTRKGWAARQDNVTFAQMLFRVQKKIRYRLW
jgi:nicotinamidase-related amidase